MNIPELPPEYKGKITSGGGYTNTAPRQWTEKEIEFLISLKQKGFSIAQIAESLSRSEISVQIKLKRLGKKENTYNEKHREEKYFINQQYCNYIKPDSLLDCFAGQKPFWNDKIKKVVTNDINNDFPANYHTDALKLLCQEYINGNKYDVIDLDPFGSAYDCFDLALKIAKKGIIITLGEMGHRRWHRLDFVRTHYGIEKEVDFTSDFIIKKIQEIGLRNKKELIVYNKKDWQNISRVWFEIKPIKITEQWNKKESYQLELF